MGLGNGTIQLRWNLPATVTQHAATCSWSFRGNVGSTFRDRALHEGEQECQRECRDGGQPEDVEVGERGGLLLTEISQGLPGHEVARPWIAGGLQEQSAGLLDKGVNSRIVRIEELSDARREELLAANFNRLGQARSNAAPFVPQQALQPAKLCRGHDTSQPTRIVEERMRLWLAVREACCSTSRRSSNQGLFRLLKSDQSRLETRDQVRQLCHRRLGGREFAV